MFQVYKDWAKENNETDQITVIKLYELFCLIKYKKYYSIKKQTKI